MKVLLAATSIETFSGASKCLLELATSLKEQGIDVFVSIPKSDEKMEQILKKRNIKYIVIREYQCWYKYKSEKIKPLINWLKVMLNEISIIKCRLFINKEKFDIVHVNALTAYVVGKAAIKENKPVIWHIREFMEEDHNITFINEKKSLAILNRATAFIAISKTVCNKWSKKISRPINVIYDGLPIENYYSSFNKSTQEINVLLYGRIVRGKGQLFYIKGVCNIINLINVPCKFYFAGRIEDEIYFKQCIDYINKTGSNKYVEYIGEIKDIKKLLANTNIVCVCSTKEGFGRVTVESMLGNCLVIGADSGATPELIDNNKNGLLYMSNDLNDFSKKLLYCVNNFEDFQEIIDVGTKNALWKFTLKHNIESIVQLYRAEININYTKN